MAIKIDDKFDDNYIPVSFRNKKVQWARLNEPDEYKGKKSWKLQMIYDMTDPTEKAEATALKKAGFNVREKNGITFLEVKKAVDEKHPEKKPYVVGPDGKTPFTEDIGNGSVVNVNASAHHWDVCETITLYITGVQVVNHVVYEKGAGFDAIGAGDDIPF